MNARIAVAAILAILAGLIVAHDVRASTYFVSVQGAGNLTDSSPVSLSNSGSVHGVGISGAGTLAYQGVATALSGSLGASALSQSDFPLIAYNEGLFVSMTAQSTFSLDGLMITATGPGPFLPFLMSFNVNVTGSLEASGNAPAGASVELRYGYSTQFGAAGGLPLGSEGITQDGIAYQTGIFDPSSAGSATTAEFLYQLGSPLSFGLDIRVQSYAGTPNYDTGGAVAEANFAHTAGFPTSGPVANLPEGYTLNSLDGSIVDNHFVGVPEPSALTLAAIGMGLVACYRRRTARR